MAEQRYQVLARKWRPQRFEDVVGQEHITRTLKNAIGSGRIHHAFLFIGSRGIGKTTTARILARALNCLSSEGPTTEPCGACSNCKSIADGTNIDVIEIDGASNNSVDDVREIRDNVRMVPTNGRYKVYIIDEVHQLSASAFNALLKTLEEPPPHAVFILATTEAHKIMPTIISRCQRYDFRRVSIDGIVELLRKIVDHESMKAADDALRAIARAAEGGVRDAESILDELITYSDGEIRFQDVFDVLGLVDWKVLHDLSEAILAQDIARQLKIVDDVVAAGKDLTQFVQDILRYYRNLLVVKSAGNSDLLDLPADEKREAEQRAQRFGLTQLVRLVEQFAELAKGYDSQLAQRIALEALLIKLSKISSEVSLDAVLEKLLELERRGLPGAHAHAPAAPAPPAPERPAPAPPDPTPAGPGADAPPAPAAVQRIYVDADAPARSWARLSEAIGRESLNLGIWLAEGTPAALEGDVLVLRFGAHSRQARDKVERPADRLRIDEMLARLTANVRALRTELAAPDPEAAPAPAAEAHGARGAYLAPQSDAARAALQDARVAHVAGVFKARIVEIRPPAAGGA